MEMTNVEYAELLDKLAGIYRANPGIERGSIYTDSVFIHCSTKEKFAETIRAFGAGKKDASDNNFYFRVSDIPVTIFVPRGQVCTKRVVGTRYVEEQKTEYVTPAHEEEIVEWDCPESVLRPSPGTQTP